MQEVKLTGVIIREDCIREAKSFSATGQCTQGEFKGYMHFSELQMDYCFTCATDISDITFNTLLQLLSAFATLANTHFSINGYLLP